MVPTAGASARVEVWWLRLGSLPWEDLVPVLDDVERDRLGRLRRPEDRERLVLGAATARAALALRFGDSAQQVRLDRSCPDCPRLHGPPRPQDHHARLALSVTHAGDLIGVAVGDLPGVGLDVEPVWEAAQLSWLGEFLGVAVPDRTDEGAAVGIDASSHALLTLWTRIEALVKLSGLGLRLSPADVDVSAPHEPAALLAWPPDVAPARVRLSDLRPDTTHVAALALLDAPADLAVTESDGRRVLAQAGLAALDR